MSYYLAQTKTGKSFVCSVAFADRHVEVMRGAGTIRLRMVGSVSEKPNKSTTEKYSVVDGYPPAWKSGEIQREIYARAGYRCEHCGMEFEHGTTKAKTARNKDGKPSILTVHHINGIKSDVRYENLLAACQKCHLHIQGVWQPGGFIPAVWGKVPEWITKRGLPYQDNPQQALALSVPVPAAKPQIAPIPPQRWQRVEQVSELEKGRVVMTYNGQGTLVHPVNDGWWWVELSPRKFMIARWEYLQVEVKLAQAKHTYIVSVSGGLASAEVLRRAIEKYGRESVVAVFADVKGTGKHTWSDFPAIDELLHERFGGESRDAYRLLWQLSYALNIPIERLEDGRSIWDVFVQRRAFRLVVRGGAFYCPASEELKREVIAQWIEKRYGRGEFTLLLGMGWDEEHRLKNACFWWSKRLGYPVKVESLLMEKPYVDNCEIGRTLESIGCEVPESYGDGFEHGNCNQGCVNAGQGHFALLYNTKPDVYHYWAWNEQRVNRALGKSYTILKDERGGTTKRLSLYDFIPRIQARDYRKMDFGACGCFSGAPVQQPLFSQAVAYA